MGTLLPTTDNVKKSLSEFKKEHFLNAEETRRFIEYCQKKLLDYEIIMCSLDTIMKQICDIETIGQSRVDTDFLKKYVALIESVAEDLDIKLCYNIMRRTEVEEKIKQQLKVIAESREPIDTIYFFFIYSGLKYDCDLYFKETKEEPYFEVLDYGSVIVLCFELIKAIREKIKIEE